MEAVLGGDINRKDGYMAKWRWHRRCWEDKDISVLTDRHPPPLRGNPEPGRKASFRKKG